MNLLLLYSLVVLFVLAAVFLVIKTKVKGSFFIIPFAVFILTSGIYTYHELLGEPTTKALPEEFLIISFIADERNGKIYLWVIEKGKHAPINHSIPYTTENHQELENKMNEVAGSKGSKGLQGNWNSKDGLGLDTYEFINQPHLRKEPPKS